MLYVTQEACRLRGVSSVFVADASVMPRLPRANTNLATLMIGERVADFILAELAVQAKRELHWWAGRATHRLRRVEDQLRMSRKTVVLVNAAEPLPNLAFLI